jgi:hypothetical protein
VPTLVAIYANEAMAAPMVGYGGVCFWRESGVRRSVLCWCVWQESGFSRSEDVFIKIYFIKRFYKFCTFNAICKDDSAINYITIQHKRGTFPSTLTGDNTLVPYII